MGTPRVSDIPELNAIFLTPSDDSNFMNCVDVVTRCIVVNTTYIVIQSLRYSDRASERTTLVQLIHHSLFAVNMTVLIDTVDVILGWDIASLTRLAIATKTHGAATDAVIMSSCLVNSASLIGDVVFMNPFVCVVCISSVAAIILLLARNEDLRGDVDIRPSCFALDLDSV